MLSIVILSARLHTQARRMAWQRTLYAPAKITDPLGLRTKDTLLREEMSQITVEVVMSWPNAESSDSGVTEGTLAASSSLTESHYAESKREEVEALCIKSIGGLD